jgi:hypothetical protein
MISNFQTVQDALYALATVVGLAVVFSLALIGAAGASRRSRRHARVGTPATATIAQQPAETEDARELVLR